VLEYVRGFQTAHDRPLKPSQMLKLVQELDGIIHKGSFRFERADHTVRPEALYQALREVSLKNMVGLKSHGYLFKVAISLNLKLIQGDEKEQRTREDEAIKRDPAGAEKIRKFIDSI